MRHSPRPSLTRICSCGKTFTVYASAAGRRAGAYCSRSCYAVQQRGKPPGNKGKYTDAYERLKSKFIVNPETGCWEWTGAINSQGYGTFSDKEHGKRHVYAHRFSYEYVFGPIPEGLTLDHLCRVRRCINPFHVEPVTIRENNLRGESPIAQRARADHCPRGHPYDTSNTYYRPDGQGKQCLTCRNLRNKARVRMAVAPL